MFKVAELIKATAGKLLRGDPGRKTGGISLDSRSLRPGEVFIAIKGKNFDGHSFIAQALRKKAACIIAQKNKHPRLSKDAAYIKVKDTILALGDIARHLRLKSNIPILAVAGSNGKTTTKEMLAWMLADKGCVLKNEGTKNNHIGLPQALSALSSRHDFGVLEIGSNHFGEVAYLSDICRPNIGIITNVGPAHLEFFKGLSGVFREKSELLSHLRPPAVAVLNADDPFLRRLKAGNNKPAHIVTYGIRNNCDFRARSLSSGSGRIIFMLNARQEFILNTPSAYNVYNALAAISAGRILGLSLKEAAERLSTFAFPAGRLNLIKRGKLRFIDDTYNSNPLSVRAALEALADLKVGGRKIFVMGDMLELGRKKELLHKEIGRSITNICDIFVSVGPLARLAAECARRQGFAASNIFHCAESRQARDLLLRRIIPRREDVILVKGSRSMRMEEVLKV